MKLFLNLLIFISIASCYAQQIDLVDFKTAKAIISIDPFKEEVAGNVRYSFDVLKPTDSIYIDAKNMTFEDVKVNNSQVAFYTDGEKLIIYSHFTPSTSNEVSFAYVANPKKALYFINWKNEGPNQIWTQGQGKDNSNWIPSFDDMNEKVEFDLSIAFDSDYSVIANGELIQKEILKDSMSIWHYDMHHPMSSYLLALAIGDFQMKCEVSNSGIPLEMYYATADSSSVEPTYRYSKQMFDFLENEIGVPFPWVNYKQVPVTDFLYSGMENTTLTIFSDALVVNDTAFIDKNYVNVNAHELAHQWFGDLITEKNGTHHWLQEGFATYYALLAERDIFGDDYYYWRLYEYAQELLDQQRAKQSTSLLDPKSSSVTFYKKGAWALHVLREKVGDETFRNAVRNYLTAYQFKNVETLNFIASVEKESGMDLGDFVKVWLKDVDFPEDTVVKSLSNSVFMQEYLMVDCEAFTSKCSDYLQSDISDEAKIKVITQMSNRLKKEDFRNSIKVRQAIAQSLTTIPLELKKVYESLLHDRSYLTIESALYNLWVNFPEDRAKYLQATKYMKGFSDFNVRLLWLALNLNTIEYQPEKKEAVFNELVAYTSEKNPFELRMNAFSYLKLINGFNELALGNLIDASHHHNWRFQQFAKHMLEELSQNASYKLMIDKLNKN